MTVTTSETVVVGFDDSEHSAKTVEYAIREAKLRGAKLRLIHAYHWVPAPAAVGVPIGADPMEDVRKAITAMLDEAAHKIRDEHPGLMVETEPRQGQPAHMLGYSSQEASLLVIGARGNGGFPELLLGSVALRTVAQSDCPVMVVRGDEAPHTGRIMVGVSLFTPEKSADALEFAFNEAVLRGAEVYAVNVWEDPSRLYGIGLRHTDDLFPAFENGLRNELIAILEPWQQKFPGVVSTLQVFPGSPGRFLVDSSRLVDTVVVGAQARTEGHPGMRLGALAHTVLHHAHCPVIVVPED